MIDAEIKDILAQSGMPYTASMIQQASIVPFTLGDIEVALHALVDEGEVIVVGFKESDPLYVLTDKDLDVYILWKNDADSYNGTRHFLSIHLTVEGARQNIPESALKLKREPYGDYIEDYAYYLISKQKVED